LTKIKFITLFITSCVALPSLNVSAQTESETTHERSVSPSGQYLLEGGVETTQDEACCRTKLVDNDSGKTIFIEHFSGYLEGSSYDQAAWSENSEYFSITGHETKRHNSINIYRIAEGRVRKVKLSRDVLADISKRFNKTVDYHRSAWFGNMSWSNNTLTFIVFGRVESDHDTQYAYRVSVGIERTSIDEDRHRYTAVVLDMTKL